MPDQFDPRIYERFIAPSAPVNADQINQYNQQAIPVAVPEIEAYAPQQVQQMSQQQFAPQAQQQQMMQPDRDRIAYNQLIQNRFNELANQFGGINRLIEMDSVELAQKKAAADIASYYGPPPAIQQPMSEKERIETAQAKLNYEQDLNPPKVPMTPMERLQVKEQRMKLAKLEEEAKNPERKPSEVMSKVMTKASDYLVTIDPMLGQLEGALVQLEDPNTDINTRLSNARTLGKLINSLQVGSPDAVGADEAKMLMSELDEKIFNTKGIFTSDQVYGTNLPQFVNKMKSIRDRVSAEYNKNLDRLAKFDPVVSTYYQPREITQPAGQSEGTPAGKPASGAPIPMRFNVGTGKYEPVK